jgi:hypothetical protein
MHGARSRPEKEWAGHGSKAVRVERSSGRIHFIQEESTVINESPQHQILAQKSSELE